MANAEPELPDAVDMTIELRDTDVDVEERLLVIRMLVTAAAQRIDELWRENVHQLDDPRRDHVVESSRLLHRALDVLGGDTFIGAR
jgi:hypothetical protein